MTYPGSWPHIVVSDPVRSGSGSPLLKSTTTPMLSVLTGTLGKSTAQHLNGYGGSGPAPSGSGHVPGISSRVARTLPSSSLTKIAATAWGSTSGTARGSMPVVLRSFRISTFAWVLGLAMNGSQPHSVGASSSVALTSRDLVAQGVPSE